MHRFVVFVLAGLAVSCGPKKPPADTGAGVEPEAPQKERDKSVLKHSNDTDRVIHLDQNWTDEMRQSWYYTSQGSRLIPYDWYLKLQAADGAGPFNSERTYMRYRYLLENAGKSGWNPDGLPVGFVKDLTDAQWAQETGKPADTADKSYDPTLETLQDVPYVGLTCAACHTAQFNTVGPDGKKVGIRVDGAGALSDFEGFLVALVDAMDATLRDAARWAAFSRAVLGGAWTEAADAKLKGDFGKVLATRRGFNTRTTTTVKGGFARLDAFTGILNQVTEYYLKEPGNHHPLVNPVSYPHVWDTPYYDWIEWNGLNSNNGLGPLGRNVGEVLGTFASIEVVTKEGLELLPPGYPSTARMAGVGDLEDKWARALEAPPWPTQLWGVIDAEKSAAGEALYVEKCLDCHPLINRQTHEQVRPELPADRREKGLTIRSVMVAQDVVGTDPNMALNISGRTARTGLLQGQKSQGLGGDPKEFGPETSAVDLLKHFVASAIADHLDAVIEEQIEAWANREGTQTEVPEKHWVGEQPDNPFAAYRARALSGIWATAPYLHNGSVLTLHDLLLPPDQRPKVIHTGSFLYDPVKLGLQNDNVCPDAWNEPGSAWTGQPAADFGGEAKTAEVKAAKPDLTRCRALGYEIVVDPSDPEARGDWASGHEYGTDLDAEQRAQLLEFIKTL